MIPLGRVNVDGIDSKELPNFSKLIIDGGNSKLDGSSNKLYPKNFKLVIFEGILKIGEICVNLPPNPPQSVSPGGKVNVGGRDCNDFPKSPPSPRFQSKIVVTAAGIRKVDLNFVFVSSS